MAKLISHFKGLKTINLSFNDFKKGLSSFFIILRKLYSKRKTKLENLYIKQCLLDETSYYELGELLKCKYCKLKILSIDNNIIPFNINFFNKLKKNKSLIKLYLNRNYIIDNKIFDISKIISNTNIEHLYLHKNDIYKFNNYLRIIYRTKLLKDKNGKNIVSNEESFLTNLDMSKNNNILINSKHIKLLTKIIKETTLNSLDISHILYGEFPNKYKINKKNLEYRTYVEELKKMLINDKNKYIKIIKQIKYNKDNNKKYIDYENKNIFEDLNEKIYPIINNKNSLFPLFLKENAKKIINDEKNKYIIEKIYKNNKEDDITINKIEDKLVNYMIFKRNEKNINKLEEELKRKKLIII